MVLCAQSTYFESLLLGSDTEDATAKDQGNDIRIRLAAESGITASAVGKMLRFLYSDQLVRAPLTYAPHQQRYISVLFYDIILF